MFYLMIFISSIIFSTMFSFMKHPLAMGLILLVQTFLICLISGILVKTFWFSYILFLIFLGGMLVLFIYVTSLASNEMFNFSMKMMLFYFMTFMILSLSLLLLSDKTLFINYFKNYEMDSLIYQKTYFFENSLMLNKLFNFPINMISILMMIYLFLTLIAIVKITNIFEGPLRPQLK